jgi:class 3 adenylate cyclase
MMQSKKCDDSGPANHLYDQKNALARQESSSSSCRTTNFEIPNVSERHGTRFEAGFEFAKFRLIEAFPRHIALAMLKGDKIRPVSKPIVSLFFSDIVGFTTISSTMEPSKVSDLLDRLYTKFDRLAYLHGVQKIDVIGDSYIAATNLTEHQPVDHAARLARFAMAAMQAAWDTAVDEDDPDGRGGVQLRIGLHCGAVTGCILGTQCYKYTVLGDAVNTASRMESCGLPGRIHCSTESAALIAQQAHDMSLFPRCLQSILRVL